MYVIQIFKQIDNALVKTLKGQKYIEHDCSLQTSHTKLTKKDQNKTNLETG